MKTYNKDRIGLQKIKTLPTYGVKIGDLDNVKQIEVEIRKLVMKDFPELGTNWGARTVEPDNKSLYCVHTYNPISKIMTNLFFVQFRKPLPKPKTPAEIARETLAEIIKEWDVPDSEMSTFTLNQMKYAVVNASDEAVSEFLFFYYDSNEWLEDYPNPDPEALHNLKIGEFTYSQNFEKIKVETLDEIKYWMLNGKHTNELECGQTLVFTNFDPDPENGIDYEEFLFSYLTYTGDN